VLALSFVSIQVNAQQGFGTNHPNKASVVDLTSSSKGLLVPRVSLTDVTEFAPVDGGAGFDPQTANSLLVYNTHTTTGDNGVTPGYYYWSQPDAAAGRWVRLITGDDIGHMPQQTVAMPRFFYMPAVIFRTDAVQNGLKRNLYAEYLAQFTGKEFIPDETGTGGAVGTANSPTFVASAGAGTLDIPHLPNSTDLYYYVTYYDATAIEVEEIDENGVMTYNVVGNATEASYMNIVFVIKD